jgi:26S proteasome regulatory subunit N3
MPERRTLRSNKSDTSANGEKPRSNSSSSSNKDKPAPTRTASSKGRSFPAKKGGPTAATKDMGGDKPHLNGTDPVENGVSGTDDVEMGEDGPDSSVPKKSSKDKEGEEEMTVVVPPSKGTKLSGVPEPDKEGDVIMEGAENETPPKPDEEEEDPAVKLITGLSPCRRGSFLNQRLL